MKCSTRRTIRFHNCVLFSEMQQQLTAIQIETNSKQLPSFTTVPPEETVTWPDEYDTLEELSNSSIFIKKIMDDNYQN